MLTQEQLIAYFEHQLAPAERAELERLLADDPEAQLLLADQENIDLALRVCLGKAEAAERIKQSIFTVLRGASDEAITAHVMEETRAAQPAKPAPARMRPWSQWLAEFQLSFWKRFAPAAAFAMALLGFGLFFYFRPAPAASVVIGRFAAVVGEPTLQRKANSSTLNAQLATPVHLGDRIETGDADTAELVFNDGTTLRLNFNTAIEIRNPKSETRNPNSPPVRPSEIHLVRGQVWTKVQKLANAPRYAIHTEAATAVARGTEFGVTLKRPSTLNPQLSTPTAVLTVKEGAVDFSNALGSVQATAMTESTATPDTAPSQPVRLKSLKSFLVAADKMAEIPGQPAGFDLYASAVRLVYRQGWTGMELERKHQALPVEPRSSLRIVRVWPGSPAEQAGLSVGDELTHVNGQAVLDLGSALVPLFREPGTPVELTVRNGDGTRTVSITTDEHPHASSHDESAAELKQATWQLIQAGFDHRIEPSQWRKLEENFRQVTDLAPHDAAARNNLGLLFDASGQIGSAIRCYREATERDANNALYHYNLALGLRSIGNFERSAEEAEVASRLAPNWVMGVSELAKAYHLLSRYDEALAVLERGLGEHPTSVDLWRVKGGIHLNTGRLDDAFAACSKAVDLEPSLASIHENLGTIHWARGETDLAEAASRKAIELDPNFAPAYYGLALVIMSRLGEASAAHPTDFPSPELDIERWRNRPPLDMSRIAEAEQLTRRAIELAPDSSAAYLNLGRFLFERGAVEEAEEALGKAFELDPDAAGFAYNLQAWFFATWGIRLDEALQFAQQATELNPVDPYLFDTLAVVHFRRGEWDAAEKAWMKCNELAGPHHWYWLGKVYERKGQPEAAIAAYEKALEVNPDNQQASKALQRLRP
jgi:tetratricopeptide (TPR) repeat protein